MTCTIPQQNGFASLPEPTFEFKQFYLGCLAQASYLSARPAKPRSSIRDGTWRSTSMKRERVA